MNQQYILFALLLGELFLLYLLSHNITKTVCATIYSLTKNVKAVVFFLCLLFLPGTLIHELAHFLTAKLFFVPVGKFTVRPVVYNRHDVRLGSVSIAKTDVIRRFLIGIAPLFVGLMLLFIIIFAIFFSYERSTISHTIIFVYCIFVIGNTLFPSKKDMEGSFVFFVSLLLLVFFLYFMHIRIHEFITPFLQTQNALRFLWTGVYFLAVPIAIDMSFLLVSKIFRA